MVNYIALNASLLDFTAIATWFFAEVSNFMTNLDMPFFGSIFTWMVVCWVLYGVGLVVGVIFGWDTEDMAADWGGRYHSTPNHRQKK